MTTNSRTPVLTTAEWLETFEDKTLFSSKSAQGFQNLQLILQDDDHSSKLTAQDTLRILAVFEKSLELDKQSIPYALTAILSLLTKAKVISIIPTEDLLPSAWTLLEMLKTVCALETQHLTMMSVQVFLSYPVDVLSMIIRQNCSEVLEIFKNFTPQIEQGVSKMFHTFLTGLLTKLPAQEKKQLLQEGLPIWFNVIAVIMVETVKQDHDVNLENVECLEVLTEALVEVDYFQCPQWQTKILKCICETKTYPATIMQQLQTKSNLWHRFWIIFVKLLKNQITRSCAYGTPIQPMLEVVETAFKMDPTSRCRAFECWDILIDSLSTDTNAKSIPRYLKLLLIPLKPNNAKTEDTVQAKLRTWWNLIRKFQAKLDQFTNEVLLEFLHFVFGKKVYDKKHVTHQLVTGASQTYDSIKRQSLQAFAEIVGHDVHCSCSTDLPKLNEKMLNTKLLASHWNEWMSALKTAILITNKIYETDKDKMINEPMQILCVWRAFAISIAELPPNGVRKDMFNELIQVLVDLLKDCNDSDLLPEILLSLTMCLMEDNESIKKLLMAPKKEEQPLRKIMSIILHPNMYRVFDRYETIKMVEKLQPMTDFAVESHNSNCCLDYLLHNSSSLKLWTALAHSASESQTFIVQSTMKQMLLWPVLSMRHIEVDIYTATTWKTLYSTHTSRSASSEIDKNITKQLKGGTNTCYFKVFVITCILKNKLVQQPEDAGVYSEMLENVTAEMNINDSNFEQFEQTLPVLVDTVVLMLIEVESSTNKTLAKASLNIVKNILLKFFAETISQDSKAGNVDAKIFIMLDNIFKQLQSVKNISSYTHIFCGFLEVLREFAIPLNKESSLFKYILSKMNYLQLNCAIDIVKTTVDECIEIITEISNQPVSDTNKTVKLFTSPNVKKIVKRPKKKETVIVNTVTENGEEYAVIKSNWKLNPKMMTEKQKEKLQRKREDIPALYQDLSQSQEEFKLSKWKTDSQDTSVSSNSKSSTLKTNDDASNILKNIPSSDVVPNIMLNILSESDKNHTGGSNETNTVSVLEEEKPKVERSPSTPKNTKFPRMAIKDRVFQNFRNLIENSSPKNDTTDAIELRRTPSAKIKSNANIINSAPPVISAERPSRLKRIPKKFADVQLFGLKKRRHSQTDLGNSENENETLDTFKKDDNKNTDKAKLGTNNDNADDQDAVECCDVTEDKEVLESVTDAQESIVMRETEQESAKSALDKTTTDHLGDTPNDKSDLDNNNEQNKQQKESSDNNVESQDLHKNDEIQFIAEKVVEQEVKEDDCSQNLQKNDVQTVVLTQNDEKNEPEDKVTKIKDTVEVSNENDSQNEENEVLKTPVQKTKQASAKSTAKKSTKKSRIEKELAIDTVEGHPFLKVQSEKRLTRNKLMETEKYTRRKSVPEKLNKIKAQKNIKSIKSKEMKSISNSQETSTVNVEETQERNTLPDEAPYSEDVIESSQDSNFTTITVKSTKRTPKRNPIVAVERLEDTNLNITGTQELLQDSDCEMPNVTINQETKDDIELPQNKTAEVDKNQSELTENMDTEPAIDEMMTDDVIIINEDDRESPITVSSEKDVGLETEELAEADTQPNDPADFIEYEPNETSPQHSDIQNTAMDITQSLSPSKLALTAPPESEDVIEISTEPNCSQKDTDICSPFKDDAQRKQDFMNNTLEISPIKVQSPDKDKISPEKNEETSSDYLVVKLSSPVHSNGEPFTSKGSPEIFTEDKTSPDKRDQSPPRAEVVSTSGSPSSSLSLKKNRPQAMRPGGRAAHMVGLCVPDSLNSKKSSEKIELEEPKRPNTSTPARRNLRVLYNAVSDSGDSSEDKEQDNFLKLQKELPSIDSSPAVPILKREKRKLDVVDDSGSPASKSKRVSFHDPPVSTTVSVQKYIKTDIESPSMSHKRLEMHMTRSLTKSPKRLENAFKLDTVLSKAIESFAEQPVDSLTNDTNISLDVTPAVEVVITSELNDTDPICPVLVDCKDPIQSIASELSSPAMKDLFIKELNGKVLTVGDLAKMSELEVNRLRIKAPKVQVAKKVLEGYINKRVTALDMPVETIIIADETAISTELDEVMTESKANSIETQTDVVPVCDIAMQTRAEIMKLASTQTNSVSTVDINTQTLESGYKTTTEIITSCLSDREDYITKLGELLPTDTIIDILANKSDDSKLTLTKFLDRQSQNLSNEAKNSKEFLVLKEFLLERFDHRELMLFCSRLLQGLYEKSA